MSLPGLDGLNFDEPLPIFLFQFDNHLPNGSDNRCYRQRQSFDPATSILSIANMMKPGVLDCPRLFYAVKLSTVVGDKRVVLAATGVWKQEPIFLALPTDLLDVVDCMFPKQVSNGIDKL